MGRAVLIAFALAALCVNAANGLPDFSAKSRTSTASATTFHKKAQHPANHATGRVSGHKSAQASTRKHAAGRDVLRESRGRPSRTHSAAKLYPTRKSHSVAEFHPATERYAAHRHAVARAVSLPPRRRPCAGATSLSNGKTRRQRTTIWSGLRTTATWPIVLNARCWCRFRPRRRSS
jgi:hypothetical protein